MKRAWKQIIVYILIVCMVTTWIPTIVAAEETSSSTELTVTESAVPSPAAADAPTNLLSSKNTTVTASEGQAIGQYRAWNKLVDGNKSSSEFGWGIVQKPKAEDVSGWAELKLASATNMNAIALFPQTYTGRAGYAFPDDFNVLISTDGGKTYTGVTGGGELGVTGFNKPISTDPAEFYFPEAAVTNIRVEFTAGTIWTPSESTYGAVFSEIEAYLLTEDQKTSAKSIAEEITLLYAPLRDTAKLALPTVDRGYKVEIASSSNENVIALDGTVTHPQEDTTVTVTLRITSTTDSTDTATTVPMEVPVCKQYTAPSGGTTLEEAKADFATKKVGVFVHYIAMLTAGKDGVVDDIDELANNFDVQQFADDMEKFGAEYVVFTTWHAGQKVLYPSQVNKRWRDDRRAEDSTAAKTYSDRDVIRELITALDAKGIDLYLYVHPSDGHDFKDTYNLEGDQELTGWEDATNNYEKWASYQEELFDEIARRYGDDIKGFWVDGNYAKAGEARLINAVRAYNPSAVFTSNIGGSRKGNPDPTAHGKTSNTDYVCWEVSRMTAPDSSLGFATTNPNMTVEDARTWPASRTSVALTMDTAWWAKDQALKSQYTPEQLFRYAAIQASSSVSGGLLISTGCSPYQAADYPNHNIWDGTKEGGTVYQTLTEFNANYLSKVAESVKNTQVSTAYPNDEVTWANKDSGHPAWGVATESPDGSYIYLHVLNQPEGQTLTVDYPKDGTGLSQEAVIMNFDGTVTPVSVQDTGSGYSIALPEGKSWSDVDTIIKVARTEDGPAPSEDEIAKVEAINTSSIHNIWKYPERMINGVKSAEDTWLSDAALGTGEGQLKHPVQEQWVELDFGQEITAGSVTLYPTNAPASKDSNKGLPRDFTVEAYTGTEWVVLATRTDVENSADPYVVEFTPTAMTKLRIHATELNLFDEQWNHYRMGFNEIEVKLAKQVAAVQATPEPGTYTGTQTVSLSCATDGATIYYTTDGGEPTTDSAQYQGPITVSDTTTIRTIAVKNGMLNSDVAEFAYTIEQETPPSGGTTTSYTITVTQNEGGTISPSTTRVTRGSSKTFTITAKEGYKISDVLVDGKSVGAVSSYTFENVKAKHTITAKFEKVEEITNVGGFTDVKSNDWFAEAVQYVVDEGLMNGTSETTFSPKGATTRGMIVTILYRQAGSPEVESDGKTWWSDARAWAMANGISDGTNMEKSITREQLATMLYRYAELMGEDISKRADLEDFQDASKVSAYAAEALKWAAAEGIVTGKTGGILDPQAGATRAETAAMFMRFAQ